MAEFSSEAGIPDVYKKLMVLNANIETLITEQQKTNEYLQELTELTKHAYAIFNSPIGRIAAKAKGRNLKL